MTSRVKLLGLDFGTTTTSAVVASAALLRNTVTGRTDLSDVRELYRSDLMFTPLKGGRLDVEALDQQLDAWLRAGDVKPDDLFGGSTLLTGLTENKGTSDGPVD